MPDGSPGSSTFKGDRNGVGGGRSEFCGVAGHALHSDDGMLYLWLAKRRHNAH